MGRVFSFMPGLLVRMRQRSTLAVAILLLITFALAVVAQESPQDITISTAQPESHGSPTASGPDLKPGALSQEQIRELMRLVADHDLENEKRSHDYTYIQRQEERKLDNNGQVKSTETKTYEVLMIYGEEVERLIAKNDQPLSAKDARKEDEKIQKLIDKRKDESEQDRRKRLAKEEKEREDGRKFVLEVADAYNFRLVGIDQINGRPTYVIDGEPRPGFQPHMKEAKLLPKFRFRVWIDQADTQWIKLDATCIDTVSWGLFLARIHKGSRVLIETSRVNNEVWLPKHIEVKVNARLALLAKLNVEEDLHYSDYKKFRTDVKIVGVGDIVPSAPTSPAPQQP